MQGNPNQTVILILFIVLGLFAALIIGLMIFFAKEKKAARTAIAVSLICIAAAALSWIFNFGWVRFIMTIILIPFFHAAVFVTVNIFSSMYADKSANLRKFNIIFVITYLLSYFLLTDGGDTGELYVFFGLIHSNAVSNICNVLVSLSVLTHIVMLILQIAEIIRLRKLKNCCG